MKANINWVTPDLATGGDLTFDPEAALNQIDEILASGITRIVDLREEADDHAVWVQFPEVTYIHVPAEDKIDHHLAPEVFDIVVAAARVDDGGRFLVHCHMGINRGPSGAFAVLLDRGHDPVEAFELIRATRSEAAIYYALDALHADQLRRGIAFTSEAAAATKRLSDHIDKIWTPAEQARISHIIREKHDFDLRALR